ncbi:ribonuclease H-like domain-containing protein [Tanacetum coccineum]
MNKCGARRDAWNTGNKDKDNGRRSGKQEEPKALVTLDGDGVDWTSHLEDKQENYALMAYSNSGSDTKDYPQRALKNKGIVDSGCSRHMTGNKAYLAEYQDYNGGPVTFGGSKDYITGKGKIKTGKLDFEDVCFVKELQHFNLFSMSQMCDKKNKLLFTDTECFVLSSDFKLPDENQVLLRIPRQNIMYSFNIENIVPSGGLACLIAKVIIDESNKWHRRLGYVNFKNLNKLVKGNLIRGLPSKIFQNDHTCVACQNGKQHKASFKSSKANNAGEEPTKHPDFKQVDKEDQVFLEDLKRLKRQEQDVNVVVEALRKEFAQETEDFLLQAGAAKASSTNIVNTASTPISTVSLYGELFLHDSNQLLTKMIQIIPALDGNFLGGQSYCATKEGNIIGLPALFILLVSCLENEPRSSLKHFEMKVGLMLCSLGRLPAKLRLVERGVVYTNEIPEALVKDVEASDVDVHLYRSMIGFLMYLIASWPDIMFAVCGCSRVSLILNGSYSGCDYDGAILDWKSTSGEFHEIIDFLAQSSIHNALTWKPMSISEASIRSHLLFDDANGIDSLPNQAIFDVIQLMDHLDAKKQFVMYPRFISVFLDKQLMNVPVPLDQFPVNDLTSKVYSFIVKKGKQFLGKVTPLFASMLVQPTEDEDATSERPSEPQPTLSPPYSSKANVEPQSDPSPRPSPTTHILDSIPEDSGGKCYQGGLD